VTKKPGGTPGSGLARAGQIQPCGRSRRDPRSGDSITTGRRRVTFPLYAAGRAAGAQTLRGVFSMRGFYARIVPVHEGGHPDQGLPEPPTYPDIGGPGDQPYPDQGLPVPPPGVWPPVTPSHPIQPAPPGVPPGAIWPPVGYPSHGLPGSPGHPSTGLPPAPGRPATGLPPDPAHPDQGLPAKTFWVVAGIPGVGWRYIAVDPSLSVTPPVAPTPTPKT
jgi:hypothetical protein